MKMHPHFPRPVTLEQLQTRFTKGQLPETFGLRFTEVGPNFIRAAITVDQRHLRPGGIMNGGVSLVLVETVGSISAACFVNTADENPLGIQVTANHLVVVNPGETITATSRPVHIGRTTQIWDVDVTNEQQRLVSSGRITLLIVKKN